MLCCFNYSGNCRERASNPGPFGARFNWAGILHVLALHIAQKAELNHDWKAAALLHSVVLRLLGAEESVWLIDSDMQTPELQL